MKTKRSRNFTQFEKDLLFIIIQQEYVNIVEEKKINAQTAAQKNEAWKKIAAAYNAQAQTGERSSKQLHALWDILKKKNRNSSCEMLLESTDKEELLVSIKNPHSPIEFLDNPKSVFAAKDPLSASSSDTENEHGESNNGIQSNSSSVPINVTQFSKGNHTQIHRNEEIHVVKMQILNLEKQIKSRQLQIANELAEMDMKIKQVELQLKKEQLEGQILENSLKSKILKDS